MRIKEEPVGSKVTREDKEMVLRIVAGVIAGGVIGLLYSFLLQRVGGG